MDATRVRSAPEEEELDRKRAERVALEAELTQRELDLQSLTAEVARFHLGYLRIVGERYAELDAIEAEIAELSTRNRGDLANCSPQAESPPPQAQPQAVRERAKQTRDQVEAAQASPEPIEFAPCEDLKRLYRHLAKRVHPDLAVEGSDRDCRRRFMAEINKAYRDADIDRLKELECQWQDSPESVEGEGTGADLVRTIREIAQIRDRLRHLEGEFASLQESGFYRLKVKADEARLAGRDLLAEMAVELQRHIENARLRRDRLKYPTR